MRAGLISGDPGFQKWAVKKEDAWADTQVQNIPSRLWSKQASKSQKLLGPECSSRERSSASSEVEGGENSGPTGRGTPTCKRAGGVGCHLEQSEKE